MKELIKVTDARYEEKLRKVKFFLCSQYMIATGTYTWRNYQRFISYMFEVEYPVYVGNL